MKTLLTIALSLLTLSCFAQKTVNTNGNQNVWGTKTFFNSPVVPFGSNIFLAGPGGQTVVSNDTGIIQRTLPTGTFVVIGNISMNGSFLTNSGDLIFVRGSTIASRFGASVSTFKDSISVSSAPGAGNVAYMDYGGLGWWVVRTNMGAAGVIGATNGTYFPTNYIADAFQPLAGTVKQVVSNNWMFAVTERGTNAIYQLPGF